MTDAPDDRPPLVMAMVWTSRVTTISLEMVLPILAGYWLDQQLGTKVLFLMLGAVFGLVAGIWHLVKLTQPASSKRQKDRQPPDKTSLR